MDSFLVVGLGNIGSKYEKTRHNIGFTIVEEIVDKLHGNWREKFKGEYCTIDSEGKKFVFLKPHTFMNLSGESAVLAAKFYKIPLENTLVVYDELDIPFGTVMFKKGGGLAGHNGLKSLKQHLGGDQFLRLRVGIGRPRSQSVSDYVLSPFSSDERAIMDEYVQLGFDSVQEFMRNGFEKAAGKFSKKSIIN